MLEKVKGVVARFNELEELLASPEVTSDLARLTKLSKERSDILGLSLAWEDYTKSMKQLEDAQEMARDPDPEMSELAKLEVDELKEHLLDLEDQMKVMLLPRDPMDEKNIMLEIRAGTGGEEAALFAGDLFRMYSRYAERKGWKVEVLSSSASGGSGGIKEVIAMIKGNDVFSNLRFESGVHRVQRVPSTESQGRIHTSAATVAVLPEAEDIDLRIEDKELRIDVMRAGGPGGQSVNTTDSAVRITHLPTGMIVICQDEKSQHKNKAKAMRILKTRLLEAEREKQDAARRDERRSMVGSGDRSEKIRTYNFPQDRVTDHRINFTRHNLPGAMDGDIEDLISNLRAYRQAELLKSGI
ncbi:MAG: peptide chain release factor 1 [Deltaproteobacteria bacterium]|nr:peptide chain release factor 1 [Deltaproteobacteria bacterium]